jgi:CHAT domain-containing protein
MESASIPYENPYYWAAFTLTGLWKTTKPLPSKPF